MSMDKTVPHRSSLTAWARELLNGYFILLNGMAPAFSMRLKAPFCGFDPAFAPSNFVCLQMTGEFFRIADFVILAKSQTLTNNSIHLLRRLGKYVICFQNRQGLFNYFASDLFVEYEFPRRRRNAAKQLHPCCELDFGHLGRITNSVR